MIQTKYGLGLMAVLFSLGLFVMVVMPVSAEYYQYRDQNGNLHFTDNKAEIPEAALDRVKSFDSVQREASEEKSSRRGNMPQAGKASSLPDPNTWDGKIKINAEELDREKENLDQTFRRLQNEKAELGKQNPDQMAPEQRSAYKDRIHELNQRIEKYHQHQQEFQEKVGRFNQKLKKQKASNKAVEEGQDT